VRRVAALFLAVGCLAGARLLAPAPPGHAEWRPLVRALGPLHPVWADVLRIRLDERLLDQDVFAVAELAREILRLRPDQPTWRVHLGQVLALDVAGQEADPALRRERVRQGLAILREGTRTPAADAQVFAGLAETLRALAQAHPDWLRGVVDDPWGEALDAWEEADRRGLPGGAATLVAASYRLFLERLLRQPGLLPGREGEIRALAEAALRREGVPAAAASALRRALRGLPAEEGDD